MILPDITHKLPRKGEIVELRIYWAILRRRFWIIALVFCVVALYVAYQYYQDHKAAASSQTYQSTILLQVGLQENDRSPDHSYNDYAQTSDNLATQFATGPILQTPQFDALIVQQIQQDHALITQRYGSTADLGNVNSPAAIGSAFTITHSYTLVSVAVTWNTQAGAWAIAHALGTVSEKHIAQFLSYDIQAPTKTTTQPAVAAQVVSDATAAKASGSTVQSKHSLLLAMLAVGLIIGIALAFLVEYLDDRIRTTDDVVRMLQLPAYGEVPRPPRPGK
jgi:capsular polysaccharide biosynthesis protein